MKRRTFLQTTGLALGAMSLPAIGMKRVTGALDGVDVDELPLLIVCEFQGGWDNLLGLDPRDPTLFTDNNALETGIQPAYDRLTPGFSQLPINAGPFVFGPCIGELAQMTDHFSVIRGINMGTLTHEVGMRYFITGRPPSGLKARGDSVAAVATGQLGDHWPVPNLTHLVESYAQGQPAFATAMPVAAVGHLQYVLRKTLGIPTGIRPSVEEAVAAYFAKESACANHLGVGGTSLAAAYRVNRLKALELASSKLYQQFEFASPALAAVREHYGFTAGTMESPVGRAALASQALKTGLSRVVSVRLSTDLDTHDNSWSFDHPTRLQSGFTALARLIADLRDTEAPGGGSYLSRTTIIAYSEFGRTAMLNARGGRDHNLSNCALVAGAGINPGLVIGASSDKGLAPELIDLQTGKASEVGKSLKPEHVMTTVLKAAGLDASALMSEPIEALLA